MFTTIYPIFSQICNVTIPKTASYLVFYLYVEDPVSIEIQILSRATASRYTDKFILNLDLTHDAILAKFWFQMD